MNLDLVVFGSIRVLLFNYMTIRTIQIGPALDYVDGSDKKWQAARVVELRSKTLAGGLNWEIVGHRSANPRGIPLAVVNPRQAERGCE